MTDFRPMKSQFDHEKLNVYQDAIGFVSWVDELLEGIPKSLAVYNQLDRTSTSIPLNIAEGNGSYTEADRYRFFDIARGSALECTACLDLLIAKTRMDSAESGKARRMKGRGITITSRITNMSRNDGVSQC